MLFQFSSRFSENILSVLLYSVEFTLVAAFEGIQKLELVCNVPLIG